ncbi:MAG TPA: hypothetical protein VF170_02050 [Planctomycetaceae bacterium]
MSFSDHDRPAEPYHDFLEERSLRTPALRLDGFVLGVAIADLVLSGLRLLVAGAGIVGWSFIPDDDPMKATVLFEVGTGLAVGLTAIAADILLLCKKRVGIALGWIALGFVGLSVLVSFWQLTIQWRGFAGDQATLIGAIVGGVFAVLVRLVLNGLYAAALIRAGRTFP